MTSFWEGRRVLITGGSGFLGAWLCRVLIERGSEVWAFDTSHGVCLAAHGFAERVPIIYGSVLHVSTVESALREHGIEICLHLAAQSSIDDAAFQPLAALDVNVRGTWTVLEACRRVGGMLAVVCASSNHIYGLQKIVPFDEDQPLDQLDIYGASKACADVIARCYAHNFGLPAVAVRNVNTFGPVDPHIAHVVPSTILSLVKGESPVIRSDGSPTKAYLYALDTVEAYALIAEHAGEPGVKGEAFNVTPAEPIRVIDLVKTIIKVSGKPGIGPVVVSTDLSQKGYFEHLSGKKIKQRLGWEPRFMLEEGLRNTYLWYAEYGSGWIKQHPAQL